MRITKRVVVHAAKRPLSRTHGSKFFGIMQPSPFKMYHYIYSNGMALVEFILESMDMYSVIGC